CGRREPSAARARNGRGTRLRRAGDRRAARTRRDAVRDARSRGRSWRDGRRGRAPAGLQQGRGRALGRRRAGLPTVRPCTRGARVNAISVRGLRKAYGELEAVRGVDFDIEEGEVFGLLGPNGAGKTTTVEILEGYRTHDAGEGAGRGHAAGRPGRDFRARIGGAVPEARLGPTPTV